VIDAPPAALDCELQYGNRRYQETISTASSHFRGEMKMRILYALSALGLSLFLWGHYAVRSQQPRRQRRERGFAGPIIDINHASADDLRALGMGDFVDRIIDERPFNSKIDLLERMVVPNDIYNQVKNRITVRHAA
jgi:DNA uptake protein ComE-like DNA-binding protein